METSDIGHCLASIGFKDQSGEERWSQFLAEEPDLIAIWQTAPNSFFYEPPYATASVRRHDDHWSVGFVPANARGDDARFFAGVFSQCITLHSPGTTVEITSERFIDLR